MKKAKFLLLGLCLCLTPCFTKQHISATEENQLDTNQLKANEVTEVDLVSLKDIGINTAIVKPKSNRLLNYNITKYQVFENNAAALTEFKQLYADELKLIQDNYGLEELNEYNYKSYQKIVYSDDGNLDYINMSKFFDIFENVDNNLEIENYISLYHETNNPDILSVLDLLLPYDSDKIAKRYYDYPEAKNSGINLRVAIDYATRYAVNQNGAYYYWSGADCTNFVSQILKAGGVQEVYTGNQFSGWWYRGKSNVSVSWIQAKTFAKYMGVGYTCTSSWSTFTSNVRQGDIISYDKSRDGDYDHMAFLCAAEGTNLYIAQHTSNYLKPSSQTDWPNAIKKGYRLARIRR